MSTDGKLSATWQSGSGSNNRVIVALLAAGNVVDNTTGLAALIVVALLGL